MITKPSISRSQLDPYLLTFIGIFCQCWMVYWVITHFSLTEIVPLILVSWFVGIHITLFPHRAWSHRSWVPNKYLGIWGEFVFSIIMAGNSIGWVGIHRAHHKYADTENDPHSPLFKSRLSIQFLSYFNKVNHRFITDVGRDPVHLWFYKNYWYIVAAWLSLMFMFDLLGFWLACMGICIMKLHGINSLSHNTPKIFLPVTGEDKATNSLVLVFLNINNGEAWHHNHHTDSNDYRFGHKWYEIDPPAWIIKLFVKCNLARVKTL